MPGFLYASLLATRRQGLHNVEPVAGTKARIFKELVVYLGKTGFFLERPPVWLGLSSYRPDFALKAY